MIKSFAITAFFCFLSNICLGQIDVSKSSLEIEKISEDIYIMVQKTNISNPSSIVYSSKEFSILLDPGFKQMQQAIQDSISANGGGDIRYVGATHYHVDHGQAVETYFNNRTILLSPVQFESALDMDVEGLISSGSGISKVKLKNEVLEIHALPNRSGHTGTDAAFFFSQSNVLAAGDYLFYEMFPIIDVKGGGSIEGYFENIEYLLNLANDQTIIIPGHTSFKESAQKRTFSKEQYRKQVNDLKESISWVKEKKKGGQSLDEIVEEGLPEKYKIYSEGLVFVKEKKWISFLYENIK